MEKLSFDPYNEGGVLTDAVERYKTRTGHYPTKAIRFIALAQTESSASSVEFACPGLA